MIDFHKLTINSRRDIFARIGDHFSRIEFHKRTNNFRWNVLQELILMCHELIFTSTQLIMDGVLCKKLSPLFNN